MSYTLIDSSLQATCLPEVGYEPADDIASWSESSSPMLVAEIFARPEGTFGYRWSAWVAWRDAGHNVRAHSWHAFSPPTALVTDSLAEAQQQATSFFASNGFQLGPWRAA